jgi:integrase
MNTVQPIREKKKITLMKNILLQNPRDHLLFVFGIHCGLRISDILKFKMSDILDRNNKPKQFLELYEQKTGKWKRFAINKNAKKAVELYLKDRGQWEPDEPVFLSRKLSKKGEKILTRQRAYQIINDAAQQAGITDPIGTHTLRKTFGYHAYRQGADIALLQNIFNHSAPSVTMRYIGITQDEIDNVIINLDL